MKSASRPWHRAPSATAATARRARRASTGSKSTGALSNGNSSRPGHTQGNRDVGGWMHKRLAAIVLAAAIGTAGAVVQLRSQQQQPRQPVPVASQKLADNLWVICSQSTDCPIIGAGGNIAVRVTAEGVIIVDDKYEPDYANIDAAIRAITDRPVKYVINTHSHGDHTGGNVQFGKVAELVAQKNARENM